MREDYSADGNAWDYLPHDHARSRAYRWGEDGLLGICDDGMRLCFAIALWNEADPILKERLFGLTNLEGNHGEDVKEVYAYLDATPTASWLCALYRYPQRAFPYERLVAESARRSRDDPEYELSDTGVLDDNRFTDVQVDYAKAAPDDILVRVTLTNQGPDPAPIQLLPTLWFRNTWASGRDERRPAISAVTDGEQGSVLRADHHALGRWWLSSDGAPQPMLTENETNAERLWGFPSRTRAVKDAFHLAIVEGDSTRLADLTETGTKGTLHQRFILEPGESRIVRLRLRRGDEPLPAADADADACLLAREREADEFYASVSAGPLSDDERLVQRQAFAGLIWTKQVYQFDVGIWLDGDPSGPAPPAERLAGRNSEWRELNTSEVLSMPDGWEYPWFAAWDLAFHAIPFALIDPDFAKQQLLLLTREWYMHPNGQLPAYEWDYSDVNPPVHAWAALRTYRIDARITGRADRPFLERIFHKLLLNFTWWVNRKDADGKNVFQGGFLGLDNVGVFDRSAPLPSGGHLGQADGTAWMGFFCLQMLAISLELAMDNIVYEDVATKFLEHFLYIAGALNGVGGAPLSLWDDEDGYFYDHLHLPDGSRIPLKVRSIVGLIPLLAVETIEPEVLERLPGFARRLRWFLRNRADLATLVASWESPGAGQRRLLALVNADRLRRVLRRMLDPDELLSPYGVRSLSRGHRDVPYRLELGGQTFEVRYEAAESRTGQFGGNSNWRGPVWFPIDYLLIEALERFDHYYGSDFTVEHPTGSAELHTLGEVADDLADRLIGILVRDDAGRRAALGDDERRQSDSLWRDLVPFNEYFDGDTGRGLGAAHQTGWTALVAKLIDRRARQRLDRRDDKHGSIDGQ